MRGKARLGAICLTLYLALAQAGPVSRASRMLNAEKSNNETPTDGASANEQIVAEPKINSTMDGGCIYGSKRFVFGESVPAVKACESCLCTENGVYCSPIVCEVREGCKVLHRADHCCPLYVCECEHNGVTYSNGDKLVDPDNPCQVCYCQGGEIVCNQIACFRRDDCEPRYVPGRCCPQYDHCPPRDNFSSDSTINKIDPQKLFDDIPKIEGKDDGIQDLPLNTNNGDSNNAITPSSDTNSIKPIVLSMNGSNNVKVVSTLHIKEVTGNDNGFNNEIRIKEILPIINNEFTISDPTKSPTFPREVSYADGKKQKKEEQAENKIPETDSKDESKEGYQTPPILRIGDQLLFLNDGGIVSDNSSLNTPAPVFTVIGAEGLERVIEEPEETFENKNPDELQNEENLKDINNINEQPQDNVNADSNVSTEYIPFHQNQQDKKIEVSSENPEQILQEVTSELYATTTEEPIEAFTKDPTTPEPDIPSEASGLGDLSTAEPQRDIPTKPVLTILEEPIPIEHLPEHNPEYPPLPEDIMILSMTEDSLDVVSVDGDFSSSTSAPAYNRNDDRIVVVKRPVFASPSFSNIINKKELKDSEKILPEVLHLVRKNNTNSTGDKNSLVPPEWLKGKENTENKKIVDSPLINTDSALPDSILLSPSYSNSKEDDDSKDYIFLNNNGSDPITLELPKSELNTEIFEPIMEEEKLKVELRSPGEPLLIPEWERTTTESADFLDSSSTPLPTEEGDLLATTNGPKINSDFTYEVETFEKSTENFMKANYISLKNPDIPFFQSNQQPNSVIEIENESPELDFDYREIDQMTEDPVTNLIISTENTIINPTTKTSEREKNNDSLENEKIMIGEELLSFDINSGTKKQKKGGENKNEKPEKKGNILADLISLVGDVANIDTEVHDTEVSTVHNNIEVERYTKPTDAPTSKMYSTKASPTTTESSLPITPIIELSEFTTEDKNGETPQESDKVEFTTKKTYIDKDSEERKNWKSTDYIKKDVEIIPKVENKKPQPLEKIVDQKLNEKSMNKNINTTRTQLTNKPSIKKSNDTKNQSNRKNPIQTTILTPILETNKVINKKIVKTDDVGKERREGEKLLTKLQEISPTENMETTENPDITVMKVSSKGETIPNGKITQDKLTKRETDSQLRDSTGQINESLISIFREFLEKQYRH